MNLKKVVDSFQFSRDEMAADYEAVSSASLAEKKEIAAKYGIESKKAAEIQMGIMLKMREERATRNSWDKTDIKFFWRLNDYAEQYKKLANYFAAESRGFLEYMAGVMKEDLVKKGLDKRWNLDIPVPASGFGYKLTYADASSIKRYQNVVKFLGESTEEAKAGKAEHENKIEAIVAKLHEQLADFKQMYIDKAKAWGEKVYTSAEENVDRYYEKYKEFYKKKQDLERSLYEQHVNFREIRNNSELSGLKESIDAYYKMYSSCKAILRYTREEYIQMIEKDAIDTYNKNVGVLAEKINKWDMNVDVLEVKKVEDDPKFFEMVVTDGNHKLHCRSIWAAENSTLVTPHFRFIITERK